MPPHRPSDRPAPAPAPGGAARRRGSLSAHLSVLGSPAPRRHGTAAPYGGRPLRRRLGSVHCPDVASKPTGKEKAQSSGGWRAKGAWGEKGQSEPRARGMGGSWKPSRRKPKVNNRGGVWRGRGASED